MRKEKKTQKKAMLIADTMKYIANGHKIDETSKYSARLCKFYFPNADEIFIQTYVDLAVSMQNKYWCADCFDYVLRQYK